MSLSALFSDEASEKKFWKDFAKVVRDELNKYFKKHSLRGENGEPIEKPKRKKNAYQMFIRENMSQAKEDHPELKPKEVMKRLGEEWKSLTDEEKVPYQQLAGVENETVVEEQPEAAESDVQVDEEEAPPTPKPEKPKKRGRGKKKKAELEEDE